ncbi:MAG: response regulator [Phycisphaerales bacterium]
MRILIADGSRTMRNIIRAVLAQLGHYDVDDASDAPEAQTRATFGGFDLCLIDRDLLDAAGTPMTRTLADAGHPALISLERADRPEGSPYPGAHGTLRKPFAPDSLKQCMESALAARHSPLAA